MTIKVGQIYKVENCIFAITKLSYIAGNDMVNIICNDGVTILEKYEYIRRRAKLIAEYPTWQEAVNSPEFRGD